MKKRKIFGRSRQRSGQIQMRASIFAFPIKPLNAFTIRIVASSWEMRPSDEMGSDHPHEATTQLLHRRQQLRSPPEEPPVLFGEAPETSFHVLFSSK
mmetsp:Transcript_21866/g.54015  ORF Transcript_21866/g.54015 Transcript_21866/m.54015 type:complete len:97 (+) Transcript_21866:281-571(+)